MNRRAAALLCFAAAAAPSAAQSLCTSDGAARPSAVLERFVNADCEACWRDSATPRAQPGELALDWIVPGARGEDAPLAMGATRDALARLAALGRRPPATMHATRRKLVASGLRLRIAQGEPFNDYIGTSIELAGAGRGPWRAWLLLVEALPAGAEGSPVARNLVRNVFQPPWDERGLAGQRSEARPMQIHEGTRPSRLRLVALVEDGQGRTRAIAATACRPEGGGR